MNLRLISVFVLAALPLPPLALAEDAPSFTSPLLLVPRVDSVERAGQFQSARFELQADGSWRLKGVEAVNSPRLQPVKVAQIEVVKTTSFPVSVYLRASGFQQLCGYDGRARVHQRHTNGRFEVAISVRHTDLATEQLAAAGTLVCPAVARAFKMTIPLPVYGLAAGTHAFTVNGVTGSFTLDRANRLEGDCDAGEEAELSFCR